MHDQNPIFFLAFMSRDFKEEQVQIRLNLAAQLAYFFMGLMPWNQRYGANSYD